MLKWQDLPKGSVLQLRIRDMSCFTYSKAQKDDIRFSDRIFLKKDDIVIFLEFDEIDNIKFLFNNLVLTKFIVPSNVLTNFKIIV